VISDFDGIAASVARRLHNAFADVFMTDESALYRRRPNRANLPTLASGCEPVPACQQILCLGSTFCFSAIVGEALIAGYAATGFHGLDRFPEQ
jgi:hypothetical protein